MSEGDAEGSFEVLNKLPASSSMDLSMMNEGRYICPLNHLFAHKLVFELGIFIKSTKILHNHNHSQSYFPDWEEESHEDSGMASSFEENIIVTTEKNNQVNNNSVNSKPKSKRMTKRRSKQIQMANELIFDLDI